MKKRCLSLLLALCMVLGMVTALPAVASAKTYGDLTYEVSNGKVTITDCANTATQVDIPEKIDGYPVTMIGGGAFRYCSNLKYVTIPETVTYIGYFAFSECNSLESIVIPNSVTGIGDNAFWKCAGLTNVTISDSVNDIGSYAFDETPWLENYPSDFVIIDNKLLIYKGTKKNAVIPDGVTSIGGSAFYGRESLNNVTIPNGVTSIGVSAFHFCKGLKEIVIPDSVTSIGEYAFDYCSNLLSVSLSNTITSISACLFRDCEKLENIFIPNTVESIGIAAFAQCKSLKSITIPSGVKNIGNAAFRNCSSLSSVVIQTGVSEIGENMFKNCDSLNDIIIPGTVTKIADYAFYDCDGLKSIIIPDNVKSLGERSFESCDVLESVTIPKSITKIPSSAFSYCYNLENVTISDGITAIGSSAFSFCNKLVSIEIPDSVKDIYSSAFYSCKNLKSITIPNSIARINQYVFYSCSNLKSVIIPSSVKRIDDLAFYDCTALTNVYYSGSEDDWKKITIGTNNECLTNATIHYQYNPKDHAVDDYIIAEVSKYTSDGEYTQFNRIMSSGASAEEKFRRLNELFANNGITDVKEGIKYLSETTSYRSNYNYLTTNEIYCAYNFYDWLYSTKSGLAARSALYTDGLIFNYEVSAYLNPATYIESEYPGVKKNKTMLKKFLESGSDSAVNDIFDYTNKTAKYMKNIIKLNNIAEDAEMDSLMNQIMNCKSPERLEVLQNQFAEKIAYQIKINSGGKVYLDGENFSDALGTSASIISFAGATAGDIAEMIKMNDNIETYKKNKKFLTYIYSNKDVSAEMRIAAYQLLDDINNGYYKRVVSIFGNVFELADGFIYTDKSKIRYALEQMGVSESGSGLLTDAFATLKLATFISNIVVDAGDFVKQAAYTQGYAELSTLYAMKLEDDKKAFLADKSAENAWTFFEDYTILWNLRYRGEQQYFDMNKIKMYIFARVKTFNYQLKNEVVRDTLAHLEQCKFSIADGIEIPKSVQYVKKSVVKCPVDVSVYSPSGDLIAELKDGVESDITNEYGRFAVVRESYSGEYSKVICQSTNDELKIKLSAVGDGLVDYQSSSADAENIKAIDKLLVDNGNVIYADAEKFSVDIDGDGAADVYKEYVEKSNDEYVRAESAELSCDSLNLTEGETKTIGIEISPINTTNTTVDWFSTDRSVADVKNGAVTAVGGGDAEIHVKVCDSDIEIVVPIKVTPLRELNFETAEFGDKQIRVKVIASTILEDIQRGKVVFGLYENNRLVGVYAEDVSVNNENAQSVEHVFDTDASDNLSVRAFWLGIDDLIRPLSRAVKAVNSDTAE